VKSSNILLNDGFRAKVSDFGFARIGPTEPDQSQIETDVRGTAGYVDPEYLRTNHLTIKSDVFSYGILLLEILSGRRPIEVRRDAREKITVRWVCIHYLSLQSYICDLQFSFWECFHFRFGQSVGHFLHLPFHYCIHMNVHALHCFLISCP
jgi:serine/threonine protein kinase